MCFHSLKAVQVWGAWCIFMYSLASQASPFLFLIIFSLFYNFFIKNYRVYLKRWAFTILMMKMKKDTITTDPNLVPFCDVFRPKFPPNEFSNFQKINLLITWKLRKNTKDSCIWWNRWNISSISFHFCYYPALQASRKES